MGQNDEMVEDALQFLDRLFRGEEQANNLLNGIAELILEAPNHFDPVMAEQLRISVVKFLSSNLLERSEGFQKMQPTQEGQSFPTFYRDRK